MEIQDNVPKLKGESNLEIWQKDLQYFLEYQDPELWLVMTGAVLPPMSDFLQIPSEQEVRFNVSAEECTDLDKVTPTQIRAWIRTNIYDKNKVYDKNKEFAEWKKLNGGCLYFLRASLEESIKIFIGEFEVASLAFDYICETWGQRNPQLFQQKYDEWNSCYYREGDNAAAFVTKWKRLLQEAQKLNPSIIPAALKQAQFVHAISQHPGTEPLVTRLRPDLKNKRILEEIITEFLSFESSRRHYSAMATSTKKGGPSQGGTGYFNA